MKFQLIVGPGHPRQPFMPELRERDLLWAKAILASGLNTDNLAKILEWFNEHRPD